VTSPEEVVKAIVFSLWKRPSISWANEKLININKSPDNPTMMREFILVCKYIRRLLIISGCRRLKERMINTKPIITRITV
jgi:hypothetical protein